MPNRPSGPVSREQAWTPHAKPLFERSARNPLLTARDLPFRAAAVLNPGATEQNGEVVLPGSEMSQGWAKWSRTQNTGFVHRAVPGIAHPSLLCP